MFDLNNLIKQLQAAKENCNITVNIYTADADAVEEVETPDTDFSVGDRVYVCHIRKDGTGTIHVKGTVTDVLQQDEDGWYTRVEGDNGKHYRTGIVFDETRKGSKIFALTD
jgi:ketosteroid isomerase-like protein